MVGVGDDTVGLCKSHPIVAVRRQKEREEKIAILLEARRPRPQREMTRAPSHQVTDVHVMEYQYDDPGILKSEKNTRRATNEEFLNLMLS